MKLSFKQKDLIRRYLIWCYKTTKEDLDRIDRYLTQNIADDFILNELTHSKDFRSQKLNAKYRSLVRDFARYKTDKRKKADKQKYLDDQCKVLRPQYQYLQYRFAAIEKAVRHFLGLKELKKIKDLYEEEMTQRILRARQHT